MYFHCRAGLQFNKTGLDQGRKYVVLYVVTESKLVELKTSKNSDTSPPSVSVV